MPWGEIVTWARKPVDLHGTWAGCVCAHCTQQQEQSLFSLSEAEGTCASAFKCSQETHAGCSGTAIAKNARGFLRQHSQGITIPPSLPVAGWTSGVRFAVA